MEFETAQIHFLGDVFAAVLPLKQDHSFFPGMGNNIISSGLVHRVEGLANQK